MSFKIVRNDIVKMQTEAIVNPANSQVAVGTGCDQAVYAAAGYDELLRYRKEHIGAVEKGEVFLTPGFRLPAKYIIHAVSPMYEGGGKGEEDKLRSCYRKSLALAKEHHIKSIAFPLLSTGGFGYPKEEGMRIALDEIYEFLFDHDMDIYLVVFDTKSVMLGEKLYPDLEAYIDHHYVLEKREEEYQDKYFGSVMPKDAGYGKHVRERNAMERRLKNKNPRMASALPRMEAPLRQMPLEEDSIGESSESYESYEEDFDELKRKLDERKAHLADTFSEYLLYLIAEKGMTNVEVYKRAIVDKKLFAKIKNDPTYHPQKLTCLCLCIGAKLNLDETKDLLARAGYALSPCDMRDVIFSYFIENEIYDMIELDIQLEEYGIPCVIA